MQSVRFPYPVVNPYSTKHDVSGEPFGLTIEPICAELVRLSKGKGNTISGGPEGVVNVLSRVAALPLALVATRRK